MLSVAGPVAAIFVETFFLASDRIEKDRLVMQSIDSAGYLMTALRDDRSIQVAMVDDFWGTL